MDTRGQRLVPGSAQQPSESDGTLNVRRTERLRSGDDHVEFVRAERALGHERGIGGVKKEVAGTAEDEESMSTGKGGSVWIERSIPGG